MIKRNKLVLTLTETYCLQKYNDNIPNNIWKGKHQIQMKKFCWVINSVREYIPSLMGKFY